MKELVEHGHVDWDGRRNIRVLRLEKINRLHNLIITHSP